MRGDVTDLGLSKKEENYTWPLGAVTILLKPIQFSHIYRSSVWGVGGCFRIQSWKHSDESRRLYHYQTIKPLYEYPQGKTSKQVSHCYVWVNLNLIKNGQLKTEGKKPKLDVWFPMMYSMSLGHHFMFPLLSRIFFIQFGLCLWCKSKNSSPYQTFLGLN